MIRGLGVLKKGDMDISLAKHRNFNKFVDFLLILHIIPPRFDAHLPELFPDRRHPRQRIFGEALSADKS